MAARAHAVDAGSLGAWLVKSSPGSSSVGAWLQTGFEDVTTRCVRRTYRTDLVAAGQPVLLWVSGQDRDHPAGIYAQGRTTGPAAGAESGAGAQLVMPVAFAPLTRPVLRREILVHPVLSRIEVVRMPAGSNPSFLSHEQLAELRRSWPQVTMA